MAASPTLFDDLGPVFGALHRTHLMEYVRRTCLDGVRSTCHDEFNGRKLSSVVAAIFPEFSRSRVEDTAKEIALNSVKNACWRAIMQMPGEFAINLRSPDVEAAEALRARKGPTVLAFWHYGPVTMLTYGFRKLGLSPLIFSRAPVSQWNNTTDNADRRLRISEKTPQHTVVALRKSLTQLKRGGCVALAIDGGLGNRDVEIPFLGRKYSLSRGAAGLARLSGATIIPCTMQWDRGDWSMAIRVFDPVPLPDVSPDDIEGYEQALLANTARCFETYGRQNPGQFKVDQLATLINCPLLNS